MTSNIQASNNNSTIPSAPSVYGTRGDGIKYPYNEAGKTPNFWIDWSKNPSVDEIMHMYEGLVSWLKSNPGSPAFYNGTILLLQFTIEIGAHMNDPKYEGLSDLVNNQIMNGGGYFLQDVIQMMAKASVISQPNLQDGQANAQKFLDQLINELSGLRGQSKLFDDLYTEAVSQKASINDWAAQNWVKVPVLTGGEKWTWVDENTGKPMTYNQFIMRSIFELGIILMPSKGENSSVIDAINGMYGTEIQKLIAQCKGNPWMLLVLLMAHIMNGRDEDVGRGINGYAGTLDVLKDANAYIEKMIANMKGSSFDAASFYKNLDGLRDIIKNNPALSGISEQFEASVASINGQTFTIEKRNSFQVHESGYYNYPPGMEIRVNGNRYTVPENGLVYITAGSGIEYSSTIYPNLTFGQMAAMGGYDVINAQVSPKDANGNPLTEWDSTISQNILSTLTSITTLVGSPSSAIQAVMQQDISTRTALENFIKEGLKSITDMNQTIMRNISAVTR